MPALSSLLFEDVVLAEALGRSPLSATHFDEALTRGRTLGLRLALARLAPPAVDLLDLAPDGARHTISGRICRVPLVRRTPLDGQLRRPFDLNERDVDTTGAVDLPARPDDSVEANTHLAEVLRVRFEFRLERIDGMLFSCRRARGTGVEADLHARDAACRVPRLAELTG